MVKPRFAVGTRKSERTIVYQLKMSNCPFITKSNTCRIYQKRPLVCRQFPYKSEGFVSGKCPIFSHAAKGTQIELSLLEIESKEKMIKYVNNRIQKYRRKGLRGWFFDLRANQWVATDLKIIPF